MKEWTDEETLRNFLSFMPRVGIGTEFVQDKYGFITHQTLHIQCGNEVFTSYQRELDFPLEPVVWPGDTKH